MPRRAITGTMYALWHFEELVHGTSTVADSTAGARHLSSSSGPPVIDVLALDGVTHIEYGRRFDGSTHFATRAGDATSLSVTSGSHTLVAFVKPDTLATLQWLMSYAGEDDVGAPGTNNQTGLRIETTGKLSVFWEQGAGVNETIIQTGGGTVAANQWTAIMASINRTANTVKFGIKQRGGSVTYSGDIAYTNDPTGGGTNVSWVLGRAAPNGTSWFDGDATAVGVYTGALDETAMTALADLIDTTMKLPTTGAHVVWNLTEGPDAREEIRGMHGTCTAGSIIAGVPLGDGYGKFFTNTNGPEIRCEADTGLAAVLKDDWTIALTFRLHDSNSAANPGIWCYNNPGIDTYPGNENFVFVQLGASGADIEYVHEHDFDSLTPPTPPNVGGVNDPLTVVGALSTASQKAIHHLVITSELINPGPPGTQRVKIYLDKVLVGTADLEAFEKGTAGWWAWGRGGGSDTWHGLLGPTVIDQRVWTQDDIDADYELMVGGTNAVGPVLTLIHTPTTPTDYYSSSVYDDSPGLLTQELWVRYGNEAELIHDGANFMPRYAAGSTRTGAGTFASPYVYTVRRSGRWPVGIETSLYVRAIDESGNLTEA